MLSLKSCKIISKGYSNSTSDEYRHSHDSRRRTTKKNQTEKYKLEKYTLSDAPHVAPFILLLYTIQLI